MQVEQERLIATQSTRAKTERLALTKRMRDEKEQARIDALAKKVLSKEEMALLTEREKRQIVAESQWVEFTEELATAVVEMETQHSREVERERAGWDFMTAQTLKFEEEKMGIGRKRRMQTMSARERGGWETDRVSREGRRRSGEGREKPGPKSFEFLRTQMRNTDIDLASEGKWMKEELDADEEAKQKEEQEFQKRAKRREFNHELTKQEEYDRAKWIRGKSPPATPPLLSDRSTVRFSEECEDGEEGQETLVHQNVPKLGRLRESSSSQKGFASAAGLRESREKKRKEEEERKAREEAEKREKERMFRRELDLSLVNMPSPRPRPFTPHTPRTPKSDAVPTSPHPSMTRELGRTAIEERRRREEERKQEIKRKQLEEQRKLENKTKNVSQFVSSSLTDRKQKGTIAEIDDGETEAAQPAHFYELKELTVEEMAVQEEEKKRMLMLGKLIDTDPLPALPSVLQPPVHERLSHPTQVQKEVLAEWMEREREREEEKRKVVRKRRGELVWEREERKREREERMNEELENSKKSERSLSPTRQSPTSPNTSLSVSPTKSATPSSFTPLLSSNLTHTVELREEREEESSMTGIERKRGMGAQTARPQSGFKLNLTGLVRNDRPVTAGMTSSDRRGRSGRSRSAERSARLGIEGSPEREVSVTGRMELNVQEAYQRTLKEETEYEVLFEKRKQRFDSVKTGFEEKHLLTDRPASMGEREKMKEGSVSERRGVERDRKNGESGNRARDLLFSPSPFFDPLNSTLPARIRPHPQSARTRAETNQPQHTDRMNKETGILEDGRKGGEERRSGTRIRPYSAKSTFSPFAMNEQMLSLFVGQRGRKDQAEGERREGREEGEEKKKREEIEIPTNTASILSTPRVSRHTPIKSPRRQHFSSPSAVVVLGAHMSQKQIREQDEREHRRVTKTNVGSSPAPSLQQYFSNIVVKRPAVSLTMGGEAGDMWEKT
ncbi:hypothetical protein BLNAU_15085 [Blattamonas nauphoetae]|uniref:Uncharacterized protein n=1 Tax=Blattamonas nauphoetae TaxID=2049346 RepID=A0ABQ9XBP3_9EUKA|nr:hypothetical protein BLNAU_15085 [Blattamonas nauphoetae]